MMMTLRDACADARAIDALVDRLVTTTADGRLESSREMRMAFDHVQTCIGCARELERRLMATSRSDGLDDASEEYVESRYADVTAITDVLKDELRGRLTRPKGRRSQPPDTVRPSQPEAEHRMVARFRTRLEAAGVTPRQGEAMTLDYVADLSDADISACVGSSPGSVTQLRAQGRYRCKEAIVVRELGLDNHRLAFLRSYYRPGGQAVAAPAGDAVAIARAAAMKAWDKPASAIDEEHLAIMLDLIDRARQLDLHKRDHDWRMLFHCYFRSGMTARPDPSGAELLVAAEFEAMARILGDLCP
jgi:hypothetical protein